MVLLLAASRADFGIGDPNRAGAIVAMGMAALAPLFLSRSSRAWLAVVGWVGLAYALALTQSRGALLAALIGSSIAFGCRRLADPARQPLGRDSFLPAVAVGGLLAVFLFSGAPKRWENLSEDRSAGGRAEVWRAWPGMLVAAPSGWGWNNAAEAYHQWYQPTDRPERYRNLLSSHATWMAETGWPGRWAYLSAILAILALCWMPSRTADAARGGEAAREGLRKWLFSAALGAWVAFVVAALYAHVAEEWRVWILPVGFLGAVLTVRSLSGDWPKPRIFVGCTLAAAAMIAAIWVTGAIFPVEPRIRQAGGLSAVAGDGEPAIWTLLDTTSMGADYGKRLRRLFEASDTARPRFSIGLASDLEEIPIEPALCIFNPRIGPDRFAGRKVQVWFGEFSQSPARAEWEKASHVFIIEGVGDFVPDWPERILEDAAGKNGRQG